MLLILKQMDQYEALAWFCGGLSFFAAVGLLAVWNDKASRIPFVSSLASLPSKATVISVYFLMNIKLKIVC